MAANQTSNHRRSNGASGAQGGRQASGAQSENRESEHNYDSMREVAHQASEYWERGEDQMRQLVRNREGTAMLLAMATGLGIGLVIGATLGRSRQHQQTWRDRINMEGFGRTLMDRIEGMIPEAVSEHFGR
jgi:hypothetical protein